MLVTKTKAIVEITNPEGAAAAIDAATDPFTSIRKAAEIAGLPKTTTQRLIARLKTQYKPLSDELVSLKTADVEGVATQAVGETGRRWITPDQTVFAGRIGPAVLLIIGDDDTLVQQGLDKFFEALSEPGP